MEYKVKPFSISVSNDGNSSEIANQVNVLISQETTGGWEFVSCGNIDSQIQGTNGCFGIGAKPATSTSIMVLVFKK